MEKREGGEEEDQIMKEEKEKMKRKKIVEGRDEKLREKICCFFKFLMAYQFSWII